MPNTWVSISKEIEGKVLKQSPINEEYIAVKKIQKLLDEGNSERDVALIWNGSLGGTEKPVEKKGVNWLGVKYDTVAYARVVLKAYKSDKQ